MKIRKTIAVVMAAVMALSMTACGKGETPRGGNPTQSKVTANSKGNNSTQSEAIPVTPLSGKIWEAIPEIPANDESEFTYSDSGEPGGVIVTDYTGSSDKVRIPDTLGGKRVVEVRLELCKKKINELVMPNSVKEFKLSPEIRETLQYVNIPAAMTQITNGHFTEMRGNEYAASCEKLSGIFIPEGVTEIGDYALAGSENLASVTIPDGVTRLGDCAFYYCECLTSVTIPDSVIEIDPSCFGNCHDLASITYKGKTYDEEHYYSLCDAINLGESGFKVTAGVLEDVSIDFTEFDIPDGVTRIGERAFLNCKNLTRVTIPNSVTKIDEKAFCNCESLTGIIIPESVTKISSNAFDGCQNIQVIYKDETYFYSDIKNLYRAVDGY